MKKFKIHPARCGTKFKILLQPMMVMSLAVLFYASGRAQDIHFSQFNSSPLTLNPALTGSFQGDYRLVANFRSQWGSVSQPYRTTSASAEISILKGKLKDDYLSFGLMFFNDVAGEVQYGTNSLNFSFAYKKVIGYRPKHAITFGIQAGFLQTKINKDKLIFNDQYNGVEPDPNLPSAGQQLISDGKSLDADVAAGALWHFFPNDNFNLFVGGAFFHITSPKISVLDNSSYRLPYKYAGHIGARIRMTKLLNLLPSALYYQQASAREITAGTYLQFVLNDDFEAETAFSLGAWARVAEPAVDAVLLAAKIDFYNFTLGFSYDFNISKLKEVSRSRGAYEINLMYVGGFTTRGKRNFTIPCPQL